MSFRSLASCLVFAVLPGFAESPPPAEPVQRDSVFASGVQDVEPNLEGLRVRILHTPARRTDARKLGKLFAQTGLKFDRIEIEQPSDSPHRKVLYFQNGYSREAERIREMARTFDALSIKQGETFNDGQQFNLWMTGVRDPLVVRCIFVETRRPDAQQIKKILGDYGFEVELFPTGNNGNAIHANRIYTKPGFEKNAAWIAELLEGIEPLEIVSSEQTGADGQTFNLWIAD